MNQAASRSLKLLGLSKKQQRLIFELKKSGPLRPIALSSRTKIKRTTVNFLLKKLFSRGIVKTVKIKGHNEWCINGAELINPLINTVYNTLSLNQSAGSIHPSPDIGVEIFLGKENILVEYKKILEGKRNSRVLAIQGNKSIEAENRLDLTYLSSIQNLFKKNKIIIEAVVGESSLINLQNEGTTFLKTYLGRAVICYVINDNIIDFDMDIQIFKNTIIMISFEKNTLLVIKNENIVCAMVSMFQVMKLVGHKLDLNSHIKNLILQKEL